MRHAQCGMRIRLVETLAFALRPREPRFMGKKVERFEDLLAWQKAIKVAQHIYMISRRQPFSRDFALCDQIRRAANSIASNIAEGFERGSRAEFHRFLSIA